MVKEYMLRLLCQIRGEGEKNKMAGEIILEKAIIREPGYLYFIDGKGNVCRAKMKGRKKKEDK